MLLQKIYAPLSQPLCQLPELVRPIRKVALRGGENLFQSSASEAVLPGRNTSRCLGVGKGYERRQIHTGVRRGG